MNNQTDMMATEDIHRWSFRSSLDLVVFLAVNSIKKTARHSIFGYSWWILEPAFQIALYFASFSVVLQTKRADFLAIVISGVVTWRWFALAIPMGTGALINNLHFLKSFSVSTQVFISASMLESFIRNLPVLLIALIYIAASDGIGPEWAWTVPIMLIQATLIAAIVMNLSWLVMYVPDIMQLVDLGMRAALFLSGVFYVVGDLSPHAQTWLYLNPFAVIIQATRDSLIFGVTPDLLRLSIIGALSFCILLFGAGMHRHLAGRLSTRLMY